MERTGNDYPFSTWETIISGEGLLTEEMRVATDKFKNLEAQLDGSLSKLEEWKEQFDVMVNALGRWALEQQKILASDLIKTFIAGEEALVAAAAGAA